MQKWNDMIEVIRPGVSAAKARVAIFDFDGTVSLIRSGWMEVMVPMCVEQLAALKTGETEEELTAVVEDYVWRLTGKETIYQMMALADEVTRRGGKALEPLAYKKMYLDRLWARIKGRVGDLRAGRVAPDAYRVPGSQALLEELKERGLKLYLASGTDEADVIRETELLGLTKYFDGGVYGARDDLKSFSKAILVQRMLSDAGYQGEELLAFGDGYVEIEEVKKVGGVAVGVASNEPECQTIDDWKRKRLMGVGADFIVPNYLALPQLRDILFPTDVLAAK